jgi:hypothetical protein
VVEHWALGPERCLRGSAESNLRSSPFYRLMSPKCATPLSVPHGVRHHLSEGMWLAVLCHTEMVRELAALRVAVSSTSASVLWRSPNDTFRVEVVGELVAKYQKLEDCRAWLERSVARMCDLLLGLPLSQDRLADRMDEANGQLKVELAAWREADAEMEALRTAAARVQGLVLDNADRPTSLAASMSTVVELLTGSAGGPVLHWLPPCCIFQS